MASLAMSARIAPVCATAYPATCNLKPSTLKPRLSQINGAASPVLPSRAFFSGSLRFPGCQTLPAFERNLATRASASGQDTRTYVAPEDEGRTECSSQGSFAEGEDSFPAAKGRVKLDVPRKIPFSDVYQTHKRNYFFNREYTAKDWTYLGFMLFMHGMCVFAPSTFSASSFGCFVVLYVITGMFGITLSYHRQLSHKSFKTPKWLEYVFAYCGVQAIQGDPIEWVSSHRIHHAACDTLSDLHTPYEGFWWSHMGWLLEDKAIEARTGGTRKNVGDMANDPFYKFIAATYPLHPIGLALVLYALGGFPWVIWGMCVRTCWVYHITWFVNSATHVWGKQVWNTGDLSRNNWWVGLLAFGEGWHNNHHAFEYSARHGLEWWQFDMTWLTICLLEKLGLAKDIKLPSEAAKARLAFPKATA